MKFIVDQIATPQLAHTGSRRLPDSPYGESATPRLTDAGSLQKEK